MIRIVRSDQLSAQLLRFVFIGIMNAAVSFSIFAALILVGLSNLGALLLATVAGILFNFQTIGRYVFRRHDTRLLGYFFLVYAIIYVVNGAALHGLSGLGYRAIPSQAVLLPFIVVLSFSLNRLVFKQGRLVREGELRSRRSRLADKR